MISLNDNLHNQNQDTFLSSNNEKDKILSLYLSGSISTYEDFIRINSNIDTFINTFSFSYFNGCYVFFENIALEDLILERFFFRHKNRYSDTHNYCFNLCFNL